MKRVSIIVFFFCVAIGLTDCRDRNRTSQRVKATPTYTCPMHPQIIDDKPSHCPICKMDLVKIERSEDNGTIMLTHNQIVLGNISTMRTQYDTIQSETVLTGKVVVNDELGEAIGSRISGRIEKLYFKEVGQYIHRGQPLYEIFSEELIVLLQEYTLAYQENEEAGNHDSRYSDFLTAAEKKLLLYGLTKQEIHSMVTAKDHKSKIAFVAPASGIISKIDIQEGKYVEEGKTLYRLENIDKLWVEAELYATDTHAVYPDDVVEVEITGFEGVPVKGKVIFINPEFNAGTQILPIRVLIDNPGHRFLPGMQARVTAAKAERSVISIPRDAVIHDAGENYVWILNHNGSYSPKRILTGLENDDNVEVRYGLEENENVVVTGAYLLYSELVLRQGKDLKDVRN